MVDSGGPPRTGRFTVGGYLSGLAPAAPGGGTPPPGEIHLGRDRYCGAAYLPGGLANVTVALAPGEIRTWRGALETRYWDALRGFPDLRGRLGRARLAGGLRAAGPLAYWRRRAVADGVVLAGDAAAFMDPMTGQGVYLALRSGELAAEAAVRALDTGGPTARILAGYERERHQAFAEAFLLSRILQYVAFRPRAASHALRRMAERPDLGTRFIDAVGNVVRAPSLLRPGFVACLLGGA
jgi:flavin-dependent dehydrogenase